MNSEGSCGAGAQCYGISSPGTFSVVDCNTCDSVSTSTPVNYCLQLSTDNTLVLSPESPYNIYIIQVNSDFSGLVGRDAESAGYTFVFTQASDSCPTLAPSTPTTPSTTVTQVVQNGGFEDDDGTGEYSAPWSLSRDAFVLRNADTGGQARSGTHFAALLALRESVSLSQTLENLLPGKTYALQYSYNVAIASVKQACTFQVLLDNVMLDDLDTSQYTTNHGYDTRSIAVRPSATSQTLEFMASCSAKDA